MGHINFDNPDETRTFPNGHWDIVHVGTSTLARGTMEPGWKWSNDVQPLAGGTSCQHRHVGFVISGALKVSMTDGTAYTLQKGQVYIIEPGHDAEVVGKETFVGVEFSPRAAETYAATS